MSKSPSKHGEPKRPAALRPEPGTALELPRQRLIAAIAATMARQAARTGVGEAEPDADLLAQCALVNQVIVGPPTITDEDWERALLRAMSLRALTLAGLRAKVEIALSVIGLPPEPGDEVEHIDRVLLFQTLAEVLDVINDAQACRATTAAMQPSVGTAPLGPEQPGRPALWPWRWNLRNPTSRSSARTGALTPAPRRRSLAGAGPGD